MKNIFYYIGGYMSKWLTIATLAGLGGGLCAVVLKKTIDLVAGLSNYIPLGIAPIIGGLLVSTLYLWDATAAGFGTDHYIHAVNLHQGHLKLKSLFSKLAATSITLGFKGSGGVEGPMLVIGGSFADALSRLRFVRKFFTKDDHRILTICGAAGAIGAIFRSPLGGGIFVVELLYRSTLHYSDLFPAMLSSTMGFVVYSMLSSPIPLFKIPDYIPNVSNVPFFILSAFIAGIVSIIFMGFFGYSQKIFSKLPFRKIHPAFGGLAAGVIFIYVPLSSGTGTKIIQDLIINNKEIRFLLILLAAKMIATSATVASGGSAGLVIPALFLGAVCGNLVSFFIPGGSLGLTSSLAVSGMAASLASIANVPIAAAIMLVEMVGLRLGIPATLGSVIGYAIGHSRVIYGINNPNQLHFEEMKLLRKKDIKKGH